VWRTGAIEFVNALCRRLLEASRDSRSEFHLRQWIDIAVQRGNILSVRGTFPAAAAAEGSSSHMSVDDVVHGPLLCFHSCSFT